MIQANELRISNYLIDQYGDMGKVVGINSDKEYNHNGQLFVGTATLYYDNYKGSIGRWIQMLKPIKLTEEILLKCWFRFDKSTSDIKLFLTVPNLSLEIHATFYRGKFVIELVNHLVPIVTEVEFLHQLQNLYFALTGKELEVKL